MARKQKRYSAEFKENAVRLANESDKPISDVARDLGVPYQTLYQWVSRAARRKAPPASGRSTPNGAETSDDEARRLRRELEEVKRERDFLKKAAAFFAQVNK